jgi:hypothetical protein
MRSSPRTWIVAGQSLSMIVGLGDCCMLEENFALRETFSTCGSSPPIGFDGWKLRHWTNQFKGERFSFDLVWFRAQKLDYLFRWHSAQLFSRYNTVRTSTRERECRWKLYSQAGSGRRAFFLANNYSAASFRFNFPA